MTCNHCGREVPDIKKTCPFYGSFMAGYTVNNVTGERGFKDGDGTFHPCKEEPCSKAKTLNYYSIKNRKNNEQESD